MKAVYLRQQDTADRDSAEAVRLLGWDEEERICVFSSDASLMCFPCRRGLVGHILSVNRRRLFDGIFVDQKLPLFRGPWAEALFRQLSGSLIDGATMTLPFHPDNQASAKGFWSLVELERFFGRPPEAVHAGDRASFRKLNDPPEIDSTLTWYFHDQARLAVEDLLIRPALRGASPADVQRMLAGMLPPEALPAELPFRSQGPDDMARVAKRHRYWLGGLAAKSAIMSRIIRDHFSDDAALSFLDHGGGIGLLAAELLLDPSVPVVNAVNCDIDTVNLILGGHLFDFYRRRLEGCFSAHLGSSERFPYRQPYDIISFLGSLLYVPRDSTDSVLDRAWEALNSGGVLVVHENIKADRHEGTRDFEMMFTSEEIDRRMNRFGDISYYAGTAATPMKPEQVGDRTVFRVVQKK